MKRIFPKHLDNIKNCLFGYILLIKEHPKSGNMEKIVSDIIITLHSENKKDTFLLEAQISDDLEINPQGVGEKRY